MSFGGWAAVVTCLVSLVLAVSLGRQYLERHRTYQLWWSVAFLVAALAALCQTLAFAAGTWSAAEYSAYIVLSAAVPGLMGAGSVFLLYPKIAPYFGGAIVLFALITLWGALGPVHDLARYSVFQAGVQVTRTMPYWQIQFGFGLLGGLGAAALVLGAAWSWLRSRRAFNAGIVFGGLVFSVVDSLAALNSQQAVLLFFLAEVVGSVSLYLAVRAASHRPAVAGAAAAAPGHA